MATWSTSSRRRPALPGAPLTREAARKLLRFSFGERAVGLSSVRSWERDGVAGEELSWSVGFGPATRGFLLKPAGARGKLPGVVACYDHGHFKFYGKEKIADGAEGPLDAVGPFRDTYYSGRAFANALAREGFVGACPRHVPVGKPQIPARGNAGKGARACGSGGRDARPWRHRCGCSRAITAPPSCTSSRSPNT